LKEEMANHKSALKRIRQAEVRKQENRYYARTMRNAVRQLRNTTAREEATELLPRVSSLLDKLAKKKVIHSNKASNLKSSLTRHVSSL
jgi:small subunit ribosomal protein S20